MKIFEFRCLKLSMYFKIEQAMLHPDYGTARERTRYRGITWETYETTSQQYLSICKYIFVVIFFYALRRKLFKLILCDQVMYYVSISITSTNNI